MLELRIVREGHAMGVRELPMTLGRRAAEVGDQIEALIAFLDDLAGDPDVELNGDEQDDDGDLRDAAYIEWRPRDAGGRCHIGGDREDDEDDDPAEDSDDDHGLEEQGELGSWAEDHESVADGYAYPDDEREEDRSDQRAHHRDRIRRTRCDRTLHRGSGGMPFATYRLREVAKS